MCWRKVGFSKLNVARFLCDETVEKDSDLINILSLSNAAVVKIWMINQKLYTLKSEKFRFSEEISLKSIFGEGESTMWSSKIQDGGTHWYLSWFVRWERVAKCDNGNPSIFVGVQNLKRNMVQRNLNAIQIGTEISKICYRIALEVIQYVETMETNCSMRNSYIIPYKNCSWFCNPFKVQNSTIYTIAPNGAEQFRVKDLFKVPTSVVGL